MFSENLHNLTTWYPQWHLECYPYINSHAATDALDFEDNTPAHFAINWNQPDALKALLTSGANTTILNKSKMAPIHMACDQDKPAMIQVSQLYSMRNENWHFIWQKERYVIFWANKKWFYNNHVSVTGTGKLVLTMLSYMVYRVQVNQS